MTIDPAQITLGMQVDCVRREIGKRREVYPKLIGQKKMSQHQADIQIAAMEAVLKTLEGLRG